MPNPEAVKNVRRRAARSESHLEGVLVTGYSGQFEQQVSFVIGTVRPARAPGRGERGADRFGLIEPPVRRRSANELPQHYAPAPDRSRLATTTSAATTCASNTNDPISRDMA